MVFNTILDAPRDPIFGLLEAFAADPRPEKINLLVGIFKDEKLRAEPFSSVVKASHPFHITADYLPIDGLHELGHLLGPVVFGPHWREEIYAAHTAGGTAALRAGAEVLFQHVGRSVFVPDLTWPTHRLVFERVGFKVGSYAYYEGGIEAMLHSLDKMPEGSIVLLHACCHNPTGIDPTFEEWQAISRKMKEKRLIPFFDFAYQGFGEGIDEDAKAIRLFCKEGHEMLVAYSCSKNFSLYCHRTGVLFAVGGERGGIASQIRRTIRALYSNPPAFGAQVAARVLREEKTLWQHDLKKARERLQKARKTLAEHLHKKHLLKGCGMFMLLGLNETQVQQLKERHAIYVGEHGRISLAGVSDENVDAIVKGVLACEGR